MLSLTSLCLMTERYWNFGSVTLIVVDPNTGKCLLKNITQFFFFSICVSNRRNVVTKGLISSESLTLRSSFIIHVTLICVLFPGNTINNKEQKRIKERIHFWEKFSETRYLLEIDLHWENQLKVFKTNISVNNLNWSIPVKMCQNSTNPGCKYEKHVKLPSNPWMFKLIIKISPSSIKDHPIWDNPNKVCWMFSSM